MYCIQLRFVTGDSGGVNAVAVEDGADGESGEERRFYVADDEKAIVVVDLMTDSRDKTLGVEFFMGLLRDLTKVMSAVKVRFAAILAILALGRDNFVAQTRTRNLTPLGQSAWDDIKYAR